MHDERDVRVARGGEGAEGGHDGVLARVAVLVLPQPQHELHVVHHHVPDAVHVARVLHRLARRGTRVVHNAFASGTIGFQYKCTINYRTK